MMKKILFSLLVLFSTLSISAQITVYEYKEDKTYCTFELDSPLTDSILVQGTYRAYNFYDIPYFEMTFVARTDVQETGETVIKITPKFYYHSFLSKLNGEKEQMSAKGYILTFLWDNNTITPTSTEEERKRVLNKSVFSLKGELDFTKFPETFTKTKDVRWGKFSKELKKSLQYKDRVMGRKYRL